MFEVFIQSILKVYFPSSRFFFKIFREVLFVLYIQSMLAYKVYKVYFDNGLWKVSPNIQYSFGNYLSSLPVHKKCISFYLFCLLYLKYTFLDVNIFCKCPQKFI